MIRNLKIWLTDKVEGANAKFWFFITSFSESIFFPIPIDPFLAGILLLKPKRWVYWGFLGTVSSVLGAVAGYFLAMFFSDTLAQFIISAYDAQEQFSIMKKYLNDGVFVFTLIAAITPIPFKVLVLSAGFTKANFLLFVLASIIGRAVRMFGVAYLTATFGQKAIHIMKRYSFALTLLGVIIIILYLMFIR